MPHGKPDWGVDWTPRTVYGLEDLGEHAVRTGSIHLFDRRGDTITLDSFEEGLGQAEIVIDGLGAAVALIGSRSRQGAFCVKLTAGSNLTQLAGLRYRRGLPVSSRLGLEFSFTIAAETNYWEWSILHYVDTAVWTSTVRYDYVNSRLEVWDDVLGWHIFQTEVYLHRHDQSWHTGKLVADLRNRQYVRFLLDENEWGLSVYAPVETVVPAAYALYWQGTHVGNAGQNPSAYMDSVILTQNEP